MKFNSRCIQDIRVLRKHVKSGEIFGVYNK
jgi:hypothetical protein